MTGITQSEGSIDHRPAGAFNPVRRAQVGLGLAGIGALLLIFPFGNTGAIVGVVLIAIGAVLGSSFERKSHGWWYPFIFGSVLAVTSPAVAQIGATMGGLFALIGSTLVLVSVAIAFPVGDEAP